MSTGSCSAWSAAETAAGVGARTALVAGDRELSWSEVAERTGMWCAWLETTGAGRNVAVVADRSLWTVTLIMALIESGRRAVLLHPRWTAAERAQAVAHVPGPMTVDDSKVAWQVAGTEASRTAVKPSGDGAVVVFTSGTTGASRAVELSAAVIAVSARASAAHLGWRGNDRWLCCLPLAHVGGLSIITRCWQGGRTIALEPEGSFDPARVARTLERHQITLLSVVPTQLKALLDRNEWRPPQSLRAVLVGGAAANDGLLQEAVERGVPVRPTYGLTETCSQVATWPASMQWAPGRGIGPALSGVELAVRDGDRIAVRGGMVDARSFPDGEPLNDCRGWFVTGDRGVIDDRGWLHVLGRTDDIIISGGENVDPRTVEAALERCPGVLAACVVGVPDERWGAVVAAVVVVSDPSALVGLDEQLAASLAPHACPRRILAVEAIPLTVTGKPDRAAALQLVSAF